MDNQRYKEALYYARLGWRVMPVYSIVNNICSCWQSETCNKPGKHPIIDKWPDNATTEQEKIRQWWATWPDANVGILTGKSSGLIVLDVDPRNGGEETLTMWAEEGKNIPHTPEVITGGGGTHYYFAHPGIDIANNTNGKLGAGVDVKSDGGMVVAPGSNHSSGGEYVWEMSSKPHETNLAPFPQWLLAELSGKKPKDERLEETDHYFIYDGQRNSTLTTLAGKLRRMGFTEAEMEVTLLKTNEDRCIPPLDEKAVLQVARSVARYDPAHMIGAETNADRFKITWAEEAFEPQPPIFWIIENLFSEGSLSLVVGEPGSKKTYSMIDAAVCVATGTPWLNMRTTPQSVLIVDEESGSVRMKRRLGAIMRGHFIDKSNVPPLGFITMANFDPRKPDDINHLHVLAVQSKAKFIIIDALADIMPGSDENLVKDVQPIMNSLRKLADSTQAAIVLIHHTNKMGFYRGSSALKGAVDCLLMVRSAKGESTINFEVEKSRDTEPIDFSAHIRFDLDQIWLKPLGDMNADRLTAAQREVLRFLVVNGESSVQDVMTGVNDLAQGTSRNAISQLSQSGLVTRIDGGNRGAAAIYKATTRGAEVVTR